MSMTDTMNAVNSSVRTLLALVLVGGLGYVGWRGYERYSGEQVAARKAEEQLRVAKLDLEKTQSDLEDAQGEVSRQQLELEEKATEIANLNDEIVVKQQEIDRLDTAMRLLKVDHRVARLTVIDQVKAEGEQRVKSIIEFQELTPDGEPAGEAKQFTIEGDMVYIDNWIVKFDDRFIEQAAIDRSTSLVLFRRIFGEYQQPKDGWSLDQVGAQPLVYSRGGKPSDLEKKIWSEFWTIANDEAKAQELGIRAAHGEAVSIKVQKGKSYRVSLRASDGLSIQPESSSHVHRPSGPEA